MENLKKITRDDVEHDVLIWYVITKIESLAGTKNDEKKYKLKNYINALSSLIAANLKFDWDRFQSETSSEYKKNYSYNYFEAVKRIFKNYKLSGNIEFVYSQKLNINDLYFYIIAVVFILSYFFSNCCILSSILQLLVSLIIVSGAVGILITLNKNSDEMIDRVFKSIIVLSYLTIIFVIVFKYINKYFMTQCIQSNCTIVSFICAVLIIIILIVKKNKEGEL